LRAEARVAPYGCHAVNGGLGVDDVIGAVKKVYDGAHFDTAKGADLTGLLAFWNAAPAANTGAGAHVAGELHSNDTTTIATSLSFNGGLGGSFDGSIFQVLASLHEAFEDYNKSHPHSGLGMTSPRSSFALRSPSRGRWLLLQVRRRMSQSDAQLGRWRTQEGIMKKAVKRTKSKSSAKRAAVKLKMTKAKAARKTKTKKTTKAKVTRETRKVAVPKAPIELKTVAKKAATAAIVAAGLAALDTALDALKPNNDSPAAIDPNKSESN
jgi:hypothetical protein